MFVVVWLPSHTFWSPRVFVSFSLSRQTMPCYPPDRWVDYEPLGAPVRGTWLLPVKLPIPYHKSRHIPPRERFTETDLIEACRNFGSQLVCVVDLTYTNYYDPGLFPRYGVMYRKIFVEGHVVPRDSVVAEFSKVIDEVSEKFPRGIIAVHCTHGINRTGYLVCRYLIDNLDWSPEDALKEFSVARGYAIERDNFLEDLRSRK
ncbi:Dual specificity phosphatase 11 (RNA RNP complex 1-interacting) [Sparganum proliferum]